MQRHSPIDRKVLHKHRHGIVHILVYHPKNQRFVTHQRLVVALHIANRLLLCTPVGHLEEELSHVPFIVGTGFEGLNPEIGDAHRHAEVEADAALLGGEGHARHSAHILRNGQHVGTKLAHQTVSQRQVSNRIFIHIFVEILVITEEIHPKTMVEIAHTGHPVEAETVKMEFLHPIFEIGE